MYSSGLSTASTEEDFKKHVSSSKDVVHDTGHRNDVYSPNTAAERQMCSHTGSFNRCLQTAYHSKSVVYCTSDKPCSLCELSSIFPVPFPSV